ncbi:MAG: integral rane sensor signal transduction histidine kinase [Cytophagaceae bacterium]|jgi:signal transduction histidine kinase|nr:integral rane sensor signal transduction histidine kinase [Cytophagaceae bacterium]
MEELKDFFGNLFATDLWPARWHCGTWSDFHGWLYITSDLLIWAAYFAIPLIILIYLHSRKKKLRFYTAYYWFAAFILACGFTHLIDAAMFWLPMYRFNGLVRLATALISWLTVYHLIKMLPIAFAQKTSAELEEDVKLRELANSEMEQFNYILSHDLQEPLRKIQMLSILLKDADTTEEEKRAYIAKLEHTTLRMSHLIKDVLDYSRIRDKVEAWKEVNLNEVMVQVMEDLESLIAGKKAKITYDTLPSIKGIHYQISQVFYNLLSNSIKYNQQIPEIEIHHKTVYSEDHKPFIEITITDNGIGFEQKYKETIFDPFKRLHSKSEYEGTGIGLALVKKIVESHNGKVFAEGHPNKGSVFTLLFPVASAENEAKLH